jgi:hypothetical protein
MIQDQIHSRELRIALAKSFKSKFNSGPKTWDHPAFESILIRHSSDSSFEMMQGSAGLNPEAFPQVSHCHGYPVKSASPVWKQPFLGQITFAENDPPSEIKNPGYRGFSSGNKFCFVSLNYFFT